MKVQELLTSMKNEEFNLKQSLDVKSYIPVMEKKKIASHIIAACTDDVNGYVMVDRLAKEIYFNMSLLALYTNMEISTDFDEMVEQYDALCEAGVLYDIVDLIDDYCELSTVVDCELENMLDENSLECQAVQVISKINSIIDIFGDKIKDVPLADMFPEGFDLTQIIEIFKMLK